jgi:hypothetical protein
LTTAATDSATPKPLTSQSFISLKCEWLLLTGPTSVPNMPGVLQEVITSLHELRQSSKSAKG